MFNRYNQTLCDKTFLNKISAWFVKTETLNYTTMKQFQ